MRVDNNLNSMMQLTNNLNQSASELAKLNEASGNPLKNEKVAPVNETTQQETIPEVDLVQEMVNQIQIPIAYTANAEVISTQDATTKTLLDIKA